MSENNCVFCDIVSGKAPAHIIFENDLSMVILDLNPLAAGHSLAIPKRHVPWWYELTAEEITSLFSIARSASEKMMEIFNPDFVGLYIRGRHVSHVHVHLVPTCKDDVIDTFFNAIEDYQYSEKNLNRLKGITSLNEIAGRFSSHPFKG